MQNAENLIQENNEQPAVNNQPYKTASRIRLRLQFISWQAAELFFFYYLITCEGTNHAHQTIDNLQNFVSLLL